VLGDYPLKQITREYIQAWVKRIADAVKKPSTVRHLMNTNDHGQGSMAGPGALAMPVSKTQLRKCDSLHG
jgi:hypothetical protein